MMKKVLVYTNQIREIYVTAEGKIEWVALKTGEVTNSYRGILTNSYQKTNGKTYSFYSISLRDSSGNQHQFSVARLVYEAFIGKIPKGMAVKHKNGNILDNNYQNLYLNYSNASV